MKQIHFHFETLVSGFNNRTKLKDFIIELCQNEKHVVGDIGFVFCTDDFLLTINQQFLQHDSLTDIISFDYSEKEGPLTGEIYISIDRVKENAIEMNVSFAHELHRVIFHGILHLCGYKDKLNTDKVLMRAKEDFYLRTYFGG